MQQTKVAAEDMKKSITPTAGRAAVKTKRIAMDVWQYSYQKSVKAGQAFSLGR
jgi:hypothetical protein